MNLNVQQLNPNIFSQKPNIWPKFNTQREKVYTRPLGVTPPPPPKKNLLSLNQPRVAFFHDLLLCVRFFLQIMRRIMIIDWYCMCKYMENQCIISFFIALLRMSCGQCCLACLESIELCRKRPLRCLILGKAG